MPSYLTFASTKKYRNDLLGKNLKPYTVPGVYVPPSITDIVRDISDEVSVASDVIDSNDDLIAKDIFADILYPLNAYGPTGGFEKTLDVGGLANTKSNLGPYSVSFVGNLPKLSEPIEKHIPTQNKYAPQETIQLVSINNTQRVPTFKQYAEPLSFVPSTYTPYQILFQKNPTGSDGTLQQDSFIAQIGARTLKKYFQDRIGVKIKKNTLGVVNLTSAIGSSDQATQILQGKTPLIERDWGITRPNSPQTASMDFSNRLEGVYIPNSVIPGNYFIDNSQSLNLFGQISSAFSGGKDPRDTAIGKLFGRFLHEQSPSQLFLDYTGEGQKAQLYYQLGFNRYSPDYDKSLLGEVGDIVRSGIRSLLDLPTRGGYYVGSKNLDPGRITSPSGEVPINPWGLEVKAPVYGPTEVANQYENGLTFNFGLNGISPSDGGGVTGGLVWTSPKYNNPGFKATVGGDQYTQEDGQFNLVKSELETYDSQNYDFKQSSILDQTQRIVDSTPNGSKRLSHAGNAINQLSKVFNDGYKEITKGSKVVEYSNKTKNSFESTNVYCRVFTKDTPYLTFADLQKTDGNIRKFGYSILDNTYNLNITPTKNPGSTNIVNGKVKKYMFSVENLAWRTSNRPGFTYNDLPECERGPNGGRIMWFPPYDISFNESSSPSFTPQDFLGRPEPVYTYKSTKRSGTLSWKIVVDHPSILNTIAQKELKNESNVKRVNDIVSSFIAGCLKFDIYELAKRWNTIPTNQLYEMQQYVMNNGYLTQEDIKVVGDEIGGSNTTNSTATPDKVDVKTSDIQVPDLKAFEGYAYYFDNDCPDCVNTNNTTTTQQWNTLYNNYIGKESTYLTRAATPSNKTAVSQFFSTIKFNYTKTEEFYKKIDEFFKAFKAGPQNTTKPSVEIVLTASASAPATKSYNVNLSKRRINSIENYIKNVSILSEYFKDGSLKITNGAAQGEDATVSPKTTDGVTVSQGFNCTDNDTNKTPYDKIYSPNAMACRRTAISKVIVTKPEPQKQNPNGDGAGATGSGGGTITSNTVKTPPGYKPRVPIPPTITTNQKIKDGISKKILRYILSECDYFEIIKENNPFIYDSIKEKIRYFDPVFHSTTPEGLNSRLTFLQQCMRPGDTIPVIGIDGKPKYNNSVNTSFGAPPVLVLRVGDFYHTKIIPNSLQITYDPLIFDLNPEGIGVQPMIAKISLSFDIVGGEGLKGPIDKLQNALSFNYYANTEMYDERADWTDDSFKKIDADLVKAILDEQPTVGVNDVKNNLENGGGNTIGVIQEKNVTDSGTTGTITYQKIMDEFYGGGQSYIDVIYGKTNEIITNYNLPIYNLFSAKRNYTDGKTCEFTSPNSTSLWGKSDRFEKELGLLRNEIEKDIRSVKSKTDPGFEFLQKVYREEFSQSSILKLKSNLINEVDLADIDIRNTLSQVTSNFVTEEQSLILTMRKLDFVDTKHDGYIKQDQGTEIYNISATTGVQSGSTSATTSGDTYGELITDYKSGSDKLKTYYEFLKENGLIDVTFDNNDIKFPPKADGLGFDFPSCSDCSKAERRFYTMMSKRILTEFDAFRTSVLNGIENEQANGLTMANVFDTSFNVKKVDYKREHDYELDVLKVFTSGYTQNYKSWNPFVKGKVRKFTFETAPSGTTQNESVRLQNIYKIGNSNTDKAVFNGKNKLL